MDSRSWDVELWNGLKYRYAAQCMRTLQSGQLTINNRTMKFVYKTKGQRPSNGYTLIFGFHGGGGCPAETNNQQYNNHKNLYDSQLPNGTIWFTPRSAEDAWDMWFKDYMEDFILQIIRCFALNDLIDLNKVFITGYSAGGDGVYHLAPRMADHLAGAAMMAGHPNGINFMNIRNIGFSLQVGENDHAYNRKNQAVKYIRMLSQLQQNYGGFENISKIQPGKPHWMDRQDAKIFSWLFDFVRDPYPEVIIFKECPRRKQKTFYYLRLGEPKNQKSDEQTIVLKQDNVFKITSNRTVTVLVNSKMINPSKPVTIIHNNKVTLERMMQPKREVAEKTMLQRIDPYYIFEDQFVSQPPGIVDINSAVCEIFSISKEEKDAEYEKSLPTQLNQMPVNFNQSLIALVKRKRPLMISKGRGKGQGGFNPLGLQIVGPGSSIQIGNIGQQSTPLNQNYQSGWQKWQDRNTNQSSQRNQGQISLQNQGGQNAWQNQGGQGGRQNQGGQGGWENQGGQGGWQNQGGQGGWQNQGGQGGWQNQGGQGGWQNQGGQGGWQNQGGQGGWQNQGGWVSQEQKNWENQMFQQWKSQNNQSQNQNQSLFRFF